MHTGNKTHILFKNKKKYKFIGGVNELAKINERKPSKSKEQKQRVKQVKPDKKKKMLKKKVLPFSEINWNYR